MSRSEQYERFGEDLNVHHITLRREFVDEGVFDYERANQTDNLVSLCDKHHGMYEWGDAEPVDIPGVDP